MNWEQLKANFLKSPKSTITGVLGAAIAVTLAIIALPAKASIPVTVLAVLRALVDFSKTDAGHTLVTTPQQPEPHLEPSAEVPLNPAATVVADTDQSTTV